MPLNLTNAVATARQLLAYTVEAANFSDKMDVIFVAEMIEKFGRFTKEEKHWKRILNLRCQSGKKRTEQEEK